MTQTLADRKHPLLAFCKPAPTTSSFFFLNLNLCADWEEYTVTVLVLFVLLCAVAYYLCDLLLAGGSNVGFIKWQGEWHMLVTNTLLYNVYCGCILSRAETLEGLLFDQAAGIEPDRASAHHEAASCLAVWRLIWCNLQGKVTALTESFKLKQCQGFALECVLLCYICMCIFGNNLQDVFGIFSYVQYYWLSCQHCTQSGDLVWCTSVLKQMSTKWQLIL